jgi:hypothetical protein
LESLIVSNFRFSYQTEFGSTDMARKIVFFELFVEQKSRKNKKKRLKLLYAQSPFGLLNCQSGNCCLIV